MPSTVGAAQFRSSSGWALPQGFRASRAAPVSNKEEAVTPGSFVWNELYTRDVEAAKAFYAATVGWTFEGMPMPHQNRTYWIAKAGRKPVAGILDMRGIVPDTDPPHWLSYLEVDDVDRCVAEIESHSGRIVRPSFDVPEFGRIAIGGRRHRSIHGLGDIETLIAAAATSIRPHPQKRQQRCGPLLQIRPRVRGGNAPGAAAKAGNCLIAYVLSQLRQ
jgi:predicted enzyme related to lactoylglutathione lyase